MAQSYNSKWKVTCFLFGFNVLFVLSITYMCHSIYFLQIFLTICKKSANQIGDGELKWVHRRSQHADFKFPHQDGTGIAKLIPHASIMCVELLNKLLAYNPDDR
jgi:hypothetical protein